MKIFREDIKGLLIHLVIIISLFTLLVIVFFYWHLPNTTNHGETIVVPDLYETSLNDIEELLEDKDLTYEVSDSVFDSRYPPLTILHQYPPADARVKEGRKIFLSVNRQSVPLIPLPDFEDKSITHYKAILENTDLSIEKITPVKNPYPVILEILLNGKPVPMGGKLPQGSHIEIVIGDGMGKYWFKMTDFFGMEYDVAEVLIKGYNLNMEPLRIPAELDTAGKTLFVVRQEPVPGDTVNVGDYVKLWVDAEMDSSFYYQLNPKVMETDSIEISSLQENN